MKSSNKISRRRSLDLISKAGLGSFLGMPFFSMAENIPTAASTQTYSRYIPNDAYEKITAYKKLGIQYFNFTPKGGWILVTNNKKVISKNLPAGCEAKVKELLQKGHHINCIAFPHSNSKGFLIVTNKTKFARNIPDKCYKELTRLVSKGHKIEFVNFPPKRSKDTYLILTNKGYSIHDVPDECFQMIKNLRQRFSGTGKAPRKVHFVGFDYKGGWVILADDYYYQKNIHAECKSQLDRFQYKKRETSFIAFAPTRNGFTMFSNTAYTKAPVDDIRLFENTFDGGKKTIWQKMDQYGATGVSVAVVVNNRIAWSCGYGILNSNKTAATHPNSIWQAASISKVVSAVSAMRLVEEGKMNLTDDIRDLLTSWTLTAKDGIINQNKKPTLEALLTHTAGINQQGFGGYPYTLNSARQLRSPVIPTLKQILNGESPANSGKIKITKPIGKRAYSGGGYTVLQQIFKDVTNRDFSSTTKTNILQRIGMNDTFFGRNIPRKYTSSDNYNLVAGHYENGNQVVGGLNQYPELAAAGMYTTALDLAKFIIMMNGNGTYVNSRNRRTQVLKSDTVKDMLTGRIIINGTSDSQGLGFRVKKGATNSNRFYFQHGGTNEGIRNAMRGYPNINAGVVVLTNTSHANFRNEIRDAIVKIYGW